MDYSPPELLVKTGLGGNSKGNNIKAGHLAGLPQTLHCYHMQCNATTCAIGQVWRHWNMKTTIFKDQPSDIVYLSTVPEGMSQGGEWDSDIYLALIRLMCLLTLTWAHSKRLTHGLTPSGTWEREREREREIPVCYLVKKQSMTGQPQQAARVTRLLTGQVQPVLVFVGIWCG